MDTQVVAEILIVIGIMGLGFVWTLRARRVSSVTMFLAAVIWLIGGALVGGAAILNDFWLFTSWDLSATIFLLWLGIGLTLMTVDRLHDVWLKFRVTNVE